MYMYAPHTQLLQSRPCRDEDPEVAAQWARERDAAKVAAKIIIDRRANAWREVASGISGVFSDARNSVSHAIAETQAAVRASLLGASREVRVAQAGGYSGTGGAVVATPS